MQTEINDPFLQPEHRLPTPTGSRGRQPWYARRRRRGRLPARTAGVAPTRTAGSAVRPVAAHDIMDLVPTHTSRILVGRDAELTEITSLLGVSPRPLPARAGTPAHDVGPGSAVVLLAGDAGVGKTRLLTELRDLARREGWQVLAGHCLDFADSALPYLPFSEILGRIASDLPELVDAVAGRHPALAPAPARPADAERGPGRPRAVAHRPGRAVRGRARPARGRGARTRRCCWSSRTSTGPTSRPATC